MVQTIVTGTGIQSVRHVKLVCKEAYNQENIRIVIGFESNKKRK